MVSETALGLPSVADNCGGATLVRAGVPAGNLFPVGLTAVTYTATDSGGATATAITTVHVLNAVESLAAIAAESRDHPRRQHATGIEPTSGRCARARPTRHSGARRNTVRPPIGSGGYYRSDR